MDNDISNEKIIQFYSNQSRNYVSAILNGFNQKIDFTYKPLTEGGNFYTKETSSQFPVADITGPFYVVNSITSPDGLGGTTTTSYSYKGAKIHKNGKGFLGFSEITASNSVMNLIAITNYYQSLSTAGRTYYLSLPSRIRTETISGTALSDNTNTYVITELDVANKRIFPWLQVAVTLNNLSNIKEKTTSVYNSDGNLTSSTVENIQDATTVATTVTTYSNYLDKITLTTDQNNYPNKPGSMTVTKTHKDEQGVSFSRRIDYTYETTGKVKTIINDPLYAKKCTTKFDYLNNGVLQKSTLSSSGLTDRYTTFEYDNYKRFVTKETNSLDHFTEKTYDGKTGNILTITDINGNVTTYWYDSFGNLTNTMMPTGLTTTYTLNWVQDDITDLENELFYQTINTGEEIVSTSYFDIVGRDIRTINDNNDGTDIVVDKIYNPQGKILKDSRPYFAGANKLWNIYEYNDPANRLTKVTTNNNVIVSYDYTGRTVRTTVADQWSSRTINATGKIESASDLGGTINYYYYASGDVDNIAAPGSTTNIYYDIYGRQSRLIDQDAGTNNYQYNAFGELAYQQDNKLNNTSFYYDQLGRIDYIVNSEGTTDYEYYATGNGKGQLKKITGPAPKSIYYSFIYDKFGRIISRTNSIETNQIFTTDYAYDQFNRINEIYYPSGFAVQYQYNSFGYLDKVNRKDNNDIIWKAGNLNELGQWTDYTLGNNLLLTQNTYINDLPQIIKTKKVSSGSYIQNLYHSFNVTTGNLNFRTDFLHQVGTNYLTETFHYDNLNRMDWYQVINQNQNVITYDNAKTGNIQSKGLVGDFKYEGSSVHAVTKIENAGSIPTADQIIHYTCFNKVSDILENSGQKALYFTYGPDYSRVKTEYMQNGGSVRSIFYDGLYERETGNNARELNYIIGGDGLAAIYEIKNGTGHIYYTLKDHLGSLQVIADENGNIARYNNVDQVYSFDPWGRRRNPNDWTYNYTPSNLLFSRGFTGHEHIDEFSLINMNSRLYDPYLGRFLSPDIFIPIPGYTQSYNRFGYAFNNPMVYTDPNGNNPAAIVLAGMILFMGGMITHDVAYNNGNYTLSQVGSYMQLGGSLMMSFGISSGVSTYINSTSSLFLQTMARTANITAQMGFSMMAGNDDLTSAIIWGVVGTITPVLLDGIGSIKMSGTIGNAGGKIKYSYLVTVADQFNELLDNIHLQGVGNSASKLLSDFGPSLSTIVASFQELWDNYPSGHILHVNPNTGLDQYSGTHCAIDLSHSLIKSGLDLSAISGGRCEYCSYGMQHILGAQDLANGLKSIYKVTKLTGSNYLDYVTGRKGIIFFQDYWQRPVDAGNIRTGDHIDLWNGSYLRSNGYIITRLRLKFPGIFSRFFETSDLSKSKSVWFFEIQ